MASKYHMFVGSETGLLKGVNLDSSEWENVNPIENVNKSNEICVLSWENQSQESVLIGTKGGMVKRFNVSSGSIEDTLQATEHDDDVIRGLYKWDSKFVTCTNTGKLGVWDEQDEDKKAQVDCGPDIFRMRPNSFSPNQVCTGGKENDLKQWDLDRPEAGPTFKAKNVRNDMLDLRVPVWITDIGYIPGTTSSEVVTCTGYHQVRVYDPSRVQRRPVVDIEWGDYPITCLSMCPNNRQCIVGNSIGEQALIDLRVKRMIHKYKGSAGAVRCVQCHPNKPLFASCGLDRYVKVYDINAKVPLHKIYLKSRLNQLLLIDDAESDDQAAQEVITSAENSIQNEDKLIETDDEDDDDDELWSKLEQVSNSSHKLKRKTVRNNVELSSKKSQGKRKRLKVQKS